MSNRHADISSKPIYPSCFLERVRQKSSCPPTIKPPTSQATTLSQVTKNTKQARPLQLPLTALCANPSKLSSLANICDPPKRAPTRNSMTTTHPASPRAYKPASTTPACRASREEEYKRGPTSSDATGTGTRLRPPKVACNMLTRDTR